MKINVIVIFIACALFQNLKFAKAQKYPKTYTPTVGDVLPSYTFDNLRNSQNEKVSLAELRGKWLVIDFWSKDCSGCLKSFQKMNEIQIRYGDQLQVLMVATVADITLEHNNKVIKREQATKDLYERLNSKYQLKFMVSFDKVLEEFYNLYSLPYILILDPKGVIRGITSSLSEEQIELFLSGQTPELKIAYTRDELDLITKNYAECNLLPSANIDKVGLDSLRGVHSQISLFDRELMPMLPSIDLNKPDLPSSKRAFTEGIFEMSKIPITSLFYTAFFGLTSWNISDSTYSRRFSREIICETEKSIRLLHDKSDYAYSLLLPSSMSTADYLKNVMQKDLQLYFGVKARVEKRLMPVYCLTVSDKKLVKNILSIGDSEKYKQDPDIPPTHQLILNTASVQRLCDLISGFTGLKYPIIDKTNIDVPIDVALYAYIYDLNEIKEKLGEIGLALTTGKEIFETIVIYNDFVFN